MADRNERATILDPRRNQTIERRKLFEEMLLKEMPGSSRTNEPMHAVLEGELGESEMMEGSEGQIVRNHALIHYLATLANSNSTSDKFDFDFVQSLLNNGADINSTDKTGQTVFHEVARSWNIDVATFLIKQGANMNQQDHYGRSPLHVAAAVDYAEMVEFLLQNGADIDIKTTGEGQAPIHFAAKNDAINSLQMLLGYGADIDARDSKNRTPLQVSAEMNRSKAAKLLISEGAPAGVYDDLGNSALSLLIEKIPEVALGAMDQFHSVDAINRKEFYFLNYLEGTKLKERKTPARTPLEIAVQNERFDIIMHPIMQRLVGVKWQMYGKWGAVQDLALNLAYTILWTVLAVTLPNYGRDLYLPLGDNSWRLIIGILLILFTILEIRKQVVNTMITRHELKKWREWRAAELERDVKYCHPRWPQEAQYLKAEIKAVRNLSLISGSDWWIYFDWAALMLILATIASHVTFFHYSTDSSKEVHHSILIPLLLILWLRIFKYARPFEGAGPFVVIFGHVLGDIMKWAFLNTIIIIPFTCAFWITFGAISSTPVDGYDSVGPLLYNVFSMMVVNSHSYDKLEKANPVMARLLCGSFIGIAAIVTLNLLIALLSNTFERLYENAVANAVMQRARTILLLQKSLRKKTKKKYYDFIKQNGSPEVIVKTLGRLLMMDGDDHATIDHVHEDVKIIVSILGEKFGKKFGKGKKSDLDFVKMNVTKIKRFQEELIVDVKNMKQALEEITSQVKEINTINNNGINSGNNNDDNKLEGNINITTATATTSNNSTTTTSQSVKTIPTKLSPVDGTKASKLRFRKVSENSSDDDSETETSDTDSTTKYNQHGKSRSSSRHNHKKSTDLRHLYDNRKTRSDGSLEAEHRKLHFDPKIHDVTRHHAYPSRPGSQMLGMNLPYGAQPLNQHNYLVNHYPDIQNNNNLQNLGHPSNDTLAYNQASNVNNPWFSLSDRSNQQQLMSTENPRFYQRHNHQPQLGNVQVPVQRNQRLGLFPYDMRESSKWYFNSNWPSHAQSVENMMSLKTLSQQHRPRATKRFQQPLEMPNSEYEYQNYGFQPTDQEVQPMPNWYQNDDKLTDTKQESSLLLSEKQRYSVSSAIPERPAEIVFRSSPRKNVVEESAAVQQERDKPEPSQQSKIVERVHHVSDSTQTIPEIDVLLAERADAISLTPKNAAKERGWYNQYRPSTPVAPEIIEKVVFFQGKIDENQSNTPGQQNESHTTTEGQRKTLVSEVSEQSLSPAFSLKDVRTKSIADNDVFLPSSDTTEIALNGAEQGEESKTQENFTPTTTSVSSNEMAEDPVDSSQTEPSPEESEAVDDNEIPRNIPSGGVDATDQPSSELTETKTDVAPHIGWM